MSRWETWQGVPSTFQGGVYALYREGALIYIGRTGNLHARLTTHMRRLRFDIAKVSYCAGIPIQMVRERRLLVRLRPPMNRVLPKVFKTNGYQFAQWPIDRRTT